MDESTRSRSCVLTGLTLRGDNERQRCELGARLSCPSGELLDAYEAWCSSNRRKPLQTRAWGEGLRALGCVSDKAGGERTWFNIALREPMEV